MNIQSIILIFIIIFFVIRIILGMNNKSKTGRGCRGCCSSCNRSCNNKLR